MRVLRTVAIATVLLGAGIGGTAVAVLIGHPPGAAAAATPAALVGDTNVEPTASAVTAGTTRAWQYKASTSGTSITESVYIDGSTNSATHFVVSVYSNSTGAPDVLLGSAGRTVTPDAWNTVTISGVPISAGRQYWLGILGTDGQLGYRDVYGACNTADAPKGQPADPPVTWTTPSADAGGCASLYVAGSTDPITSSTTTDSGTSTTSSTTTTTPTTTTSTTSTTTTTTTGGGKLQSAGWWPAWETNVSMSSIPWNALTQIIMFSDTAMTSAPWLNTANHGVTPDNQQQLVSLAHQHGDTAILSIGGSDDQNWSTACNSTNSAAFVNAAISQMQQYGYDGVELDIEEGPWVGTSDFNACVRTFHDMLKATTTAAGKPPLLTLDADPTWESSYVPPVAPYLDQVNLMDYESVCGALCAAVANSITQLTTLGVPASKLYDGIGLDPGMPASGNPADCGAKAKYLSSRGVGGVMTWTIQDDYPDYSCLRAIAPYVG